MNVIVYAIKNKISGSMYIGSTTNWKERKKSHIKTLTGKLNKPTKLYQASKKYKLEDFEFLILEENISLDQIFIKEEYWIVFYDSINKGYNLCIPSSLTESHLLFLKSKKYENRHVPNNLKRISKEEWLSNRKDNPNFKTKDLFKVEIRNTDKYKIVYELDNDYNIIKEYISIKFLFIELDKAEQVMRLYLKYNGAKPFKFRKINNRIFIKKEDYNFPLLKEKEIIIKKKYIQPTKPIILVKEGIEKLFNSHSEACKFLEISKPKLYNLIKGFRNKGGRVIVKVNNIKGWVIKDGV